MAAKSSNSSGVPGSPDAAAGERRASPSAPSGNGDDENSVYDEILRQAARAPEVEPARLDELSERAAQASLEGKSLGHFRVLARLGSGGMGVVYRAEDEILRRPVALKVLSAWLSGSARSHSLLEEARHAAAVSHPNIAAIYEVGEANGMAFIAMELVEGRSLRVRLNEGRIGLEEALHVATQIARGLSRAHQGGIVHRDLKPDNVMIGPDGFVKILDFGLAAPVAAESAPGGGAPEAARPRRVVGTYAYMSPEQARGAEVDARSDIYSFGILLFELMAGTRPSPGQAQPGTLALEGVPPARAEALRKLLSACLHESPEARPADGAALVEALQAIPPVSVPVPVPRARSWRVLGFAVAVVLGLVALGDFIRRITPPGPMTLNERRLTANPPENLLVDAALSPNGQVLAYTDQTGLLLRWLDPERTEPLPLPDDRLPEYVAWFPDGRELLLTTHRPGLPGKNLWRLPIDGGQPRLLATGHFDTPRVSPDGTALAWTDEAGGLRVSSLDVSTSRRVLHVSTKERLIRPFWSPDGKRIAVLRVTDETASVDIVDVERGAATELLRTPRLVNRVGEGALVWAGNALIYGLSELPPKESAFSFWLQPVDRMGRPLDKPRLMHTWTGASPDLISASADGRHLAYAQLQYQADVYAGVLEDAGRRMAPPRRLTLSERDEFASGFTPDGTKVLITSDRDGTNDIYFQDYNAGPPKKLELPVRAFRTWPAFAPSGKDVLFWRYPFPASEEPRRAELVRASVDTKESTPLLEMKTTSAWTWLPSSPWGAHFVCAPSGRCLLGELEGGQSILSELDPHSGRGPEVLRLEAMTVDAHAWALSPDGTSISLPGRMGEIRIVELATGRITTRNVADECLLRNVAFSADGSALYATGSCPKDRRFSKIFHIGAEGPATVLWEQTSTWFTRPLASRDGKHLVFATLPLDNDIWLVDGY